MKAPDIVESWLWQDGESIIERLLARSSRTIGLPVSAPMKPRRSDHYSRQYMLMRRQRVRRAMQREEGAQ